jgi:dihydroceramidase
MCLRIRFNSVSFRHLLTGIAEYYNIVWSTWLRYCLQGRQDEVELIWPSWWSMPHLERRRKEPSKVH